MPLVSTEFFEVPLHARAKSNDYKYKGVSLIWHQEQGAKRKKKTTYTQSIIYHSLMRHLLWQKSVLHFHTCTHIICVYSPFEVFHYVGNVAVTFVHSFIIGEEGLKVLMLILEVPAQVSCQFVHRSLSLALSLPPSFFKSNIVGTKNKYVVVKA